MDCCSSRFIDYHSIPSARPSRGAWVFVVLFSVAFLYLISTPVEIEDFGERWEARGYEHRSSTYESGDCIDGKQRRLPKSGVFR